MRVAERSPEIIEVPQFAPHPFPNVGSLLVAISREASSEYIITPLSQSMTDLVVDKTRSLIRGVVRTDTTDEELKVRRATQAIRRDRILKYNAIAVGSCLASPHKAVNALGRYLAGYSHGMIAAIHNTDMRQVSEQIDQGMTDPSVIAGALHVKGYNGVERDVSGIAFARGSRFAPSKDSPFECVIPSDFYLAETPLIDDD